PARPDPRAPPFPYTTLFRSPRALLALEPVEARGDDREAHPVTECVVDDRTEDDVGVLVRGLADDVGGLVELEQPEVGRSELNERSEEHTSELQSRGHLVCRL